MKKLICLAMTLILTLGLCVTAFATSFYLESAGVTIEVPDGMTASDQSDDTSSELSITVDDNPDVVYVYKVAYMEEFAGRGLHDLSEEELQQLGGGIASAMEDPSFEETEINEYPVLVAANGEGTQLHYISVLNGWLCDVAAIKNDVLSDDEIACAAQLLASITFDTDGEDAA